MSLGKADTVKAETVHEAASEQEALALLAGEGPKARLHRQAMSWLISASIYMLLRLQTGSIPASACHLGPCCTSSPCQGAREPRSICSTLMLVLTAALAKSGSLLFFWCQAKQTRCTVQLPCRWLCFQALTCAYTQQHRCRHSFVVPQGHLCACVPGWGSFSCMIEQGRGSLLSAWTTCQSPF